jgi:hypothetical protein
MKLTPPKKQKTGKTKPKKSKIWKILKIIWFLIGFLIILWTLFWFVQLNKTGDLGGVLALTMLFASGIYMLIIFIALTILIFLIGLMIKITKTFIKHKQ